MDFITGLPSCANGCNAIFTCDDCLTKYIVLSCMYFRGRGVECQTSCTVVFLGCSQTMLACLIMWSMIETHLFTAEFWTKTFGAPLDLVQSLGSAYHP